MLILVGFMLDEIDRMHGICKERFEKIERRFDRMEDTVNTIKFEYDIVNILVKTIKDFEQRIVIIENKIA